MNPHTAFEHHAALIAALLRPDAYPHAVREVELLETHISSVLLAGDFAYKVKKPVNLGFLDFSSLAQRRFYCEEEMRLNRRTAPDLYLDVVPITGDVLQPRIGGAGEAIDYAVRMHRFADDALLDSRARVGRLGAADIDRLAERIAAFHLSLTSSSAAIDGSAGTADEILRWTRENFVQLRSRGLDPEVASVLDRVEQWTMQEFARRRALFTTRRAGGFVRECHGDLHLGNIVMLDEVPVPFDAIEFNPRLRWIDVVSDLAFTHMDLIDHGLAPLAWRLLDRYLQVTGDYAGLGVLRFYAVYRALVRAKVARIRAEQGDADPATRAAALKACAHYVRMAATLTREAPRLLALTCGVSGAGKTTVAGHLLEQLGGVRVRSDVERKRLFDVGPTARLRGAAQQQLYSLEANRRTYARLAEIGRTIVDAGYAALIDAAFLRRAERDEFRALARTCGARFALIECTAAADVLRARVARRVADDADASDANIGVLERQLVTHEPVAEAERADTWQVQTDVEPGALAARCAEVAGALVGGARVGGAR